MPKAKPVVELVVPPQDGKICGTICICQMTAVLSSVALVYLTVAIYVPFSRAFQSGISEVPIMCTTVRSTVVDTCDWGSCGEWCLSKTSGSCVQIHVNLRRNGSEILLANCTNITNKTCYGIDRENAKKSKCIADECRNLTGTFNCSEGICFNITDAFECVFSDTDPPLKCSGRRGKITCIDIDGLFNCDRGMCEKIRTPYNCDRRCVDIPTRNKNVILLKGDTVYLGQCERALELETEKEIWNEEQGNVMMSSCHSIVNGTRGIEAKDCINGSLLETNMLTDLTNFTHLTNLFIFATKLLDETRTVMPPEQDLIIANDSRLQINLEGCVNTLKDECREFLTDFGKDGSDHNARARFPCFYAIDNTDTAVTRFDLETTYREFLVALILPSVLFVVSCLTLILCQRTVVVGDDAKMRFKGSPGSFITIDKSSGNLGDAGGDSVMAL